MRCKRFTVTGAAIDLLAVGEEIEVDVSIEVITDKFITPRYAKYYNLSGTSVGITIINNEDNEVERIAHPEWYDPMPLAANISEQVLGTHCNKLIITKLAVGASTGDLTFYCNNYYEIG